MDSNYLRLEGIYDQRTFQGLCNLGVFNFSFDFRPTNLNFFQQYKFLKLVENHYSKNMNFFLRYDQEKDFVIKKMLDDLDHILKNFLPAERNIFLEFSDSQTAAFYDQFKRPYFWHYREGGALKEVLKGEFLAGFILPSQTLQKIQQAGHFPGFVNNFFQMIYINKKSYQFILSTDWTNDLFPSVYDYFDFSLLSLPINPHIEVCYRNVDLDKMGREVNIIKKNLSQLVGL